jgi:hypothetical protein
MPADMDALNYPYIRVRSVDWLKRTLLIFPHVARMTPEYQAPADDPEVSEFVRTDGRRGPLLRSAKLWAPHVHQAQLELMTELRTLFRRRGSAFRNRFKQEAWYDADGGQTWDKMTVWERRLSDRPTFQIHRYKILPELTQYLLSQGLAWPPREEFSDGSEYLEMHPRLGEAVMATLAFACAENEGLQVVTEFPKLHGKLIQQPKEMILRACLEEPKVSGKTSAQQVAEFIVYKRCNVSKLTAERIAALKKERDALAKFRAELEELARTLPPIMHSEPDLETRLNDLTNDIFKRWQNDQKNLTHFARELFGDGALSAPEKLVAKLAEAAAAGAGTGAVGAAAGAQMGNLTLGLATGAAAGFAVAVVFRMIETWSKLKKQQGASPFRYLTTLERTGVVFSLSR